MSTVHITDPVTGEPTLVTIPEDELIVVRPSTDDQHHVDTALQLAEQIKAVSPMRNIVVLGPSVTLESFDDEQLAALGLVRRTPVE